jgi:hypothetical protein
MKSDKQINKILLMALSEPEYARPDYWNAQQKISIYSQKIVFLNKLLDAYEHYIKRIDKDEYEVRIANPDAEISCSIPLVYETDGELRGHLSRNDLISLFYSIRELTEMWFPTKKTAEKEIKYTQPIKWLKSEDSLRQLIDALKENGFIQKRDAEDIILHFTVSDTEAKQAQLEPISWLKSKALLAYLIDMLSKKPEQSAPFIDSNKKWELVKLHFVVNGNKITRSLVNDLKQTIYPNGSNVIDGILNRLPAH